MVKYDYRELCHSGIKGMKWGVRRYQNEDGTLTSEGMKHYGVNNKKNSNSQNSQNNQKKQNIIQKHKTKLIEKYKSKGYNQQSAELAAHQRMKTELIVGAIGTTVAVGVTYKVARKLGQEYIDKTFRKGKEIQNIGPDRKDRSLNKEPFFASYNKHDKTLYNDLYSNEKRAHILNDQYYNKGPEYNGIYNNTIKMKDNVKRASVKNARDIFYDKMDTDKNFRNDVILNLSKTYYGRRDNSINEYLTTGKHSKKLYDRFNQALATPEFQEHGINNKYYDSLKKRGYNAILDINDTRYSGYKNFAHSPTIFFGDKKFEKVHSRKLDENKITSNARKYTLYALAKVEGKRLGVVAGAIGISKNIRNNRKVEKYLNEHPNSQLTRKEILKEIKKKK